MKNLILLFVVILSSLGLTVKAGTTPIELIAVNYENGEPYSFSKLGGAVTFNFSRAVTVEEASIVLPSGSKVAIENTHDMSAVTFYYYCQLADQIKSMLTAGTLATGDEMTILLEGVKDADNIVFSDGTASVKLIAPQAPVSYLSVSKVSGSKIKSYYTPGDDEAKITFTFSGNVHCSNAKIQYGDIEKSTYNEIIVPVTASGSTLVADLGGINLNSEALGGYSEVTLGLKSVTDDNGNTVEGNIPGAPGSVSVTYTVEPTVAEDVYGGFESADIDNVDEIKCYVSTDVSYEGVLLSYTLGGNASEYTVFASDIRKENGEDGIYLYIPIKNLSFDAGAITAELLNAKTSDGAAVVIEKGTYTSKGKVAATMCLGISPASGDINEAPNMYTISFNNPVIVESATMEIAGQSIPLYLGAQVITNNNVITITNLRGAFFGNYSFKLKVKDSTNKYITIGSNEDYVTLEYNVPVNTFTLASVDPAAGKVASLKTLKFEFNEATDMDNVGGFDTSKIVTLKNEAKETVATGTFDYTESGYDLYAILTLDKEISADGVYTLNIPEGTVYNSWYDDYQDDLGVSYGAKYNPEINLVYSVGNVAVTTCEVTPESGAYNAIPKTITLTFSRNVTFEQGYLYGARGQMPIDLASKVTVDGKIATLQLTDEDLEGKTFANLSIQFKDELGAYVTLGDVDEYIALLYELIIPANTFELESVSVPEGEVGALSKITLTFVNPNDSFDSVGGYDSKKTIELKDDANKVVATGALDFSDWDHMSDMILTLSTEIKEPGNYTLVIPEATVYNSMFDDTAEDLGVSNGAVYNPEIVLHYTVKTNGVGSVLKDVKGVVNVYNLQGILVRTADASQALEGLTTGIYIVNGEKYSVK